MQIRAMRGADGNAGNTNASTDNLGLYGSSPRTGSSVISTHSQADYQ